MTARTVVLERANAEQSPSQSQSNSSSGIRANWTGKLLIITGLSPNHFPSTQTSPTKTGLKRKRPSPTTGSQEDSPSDPSQSNSRSGSVSGVDSRAQEPTESSQQPATAPRKRRRRGQRILEQSLALSKDPSPPLPLVPEEEDLVTEIDLPAPFLSRTPSPDPHHPDDEANAVYQATYEPLAKLEPFITALTKFNPAQRRTENLFLIAANTAKALRAWQDEYLEIDRLTAPHAPIPRKPAAGNRQPLGSFLFEDQKEADIYDYIFDPKRVGHQDPLQQRVIRDASGRELRQRGASRRTGADGQLVNAASTLSDEENARAARTRRPVTKYDGVDDPANDGYQSVPSRRGRGGGRGRGRGGRGGRGRGGALMSRRIQEMREGSTATGGGEDDDDDMSVSASETVSRASAEPTQDDDGDYLASGAGKRKGRPPGSKNLHVRSDKGIPKGPRAPRSDAGAGGQTPRAKGGPAGKQPKSEKRSESMTAWWAKRKAAAAEAKRREQEAEAKAVKQQAPAPVAQPPPPPQLVPAYNAPSGQLPPLLGAHSYGQQQHPHQYQQHQHQHQHMGYPPPPQQQQHMQQQSYAPPPGRSYYQPLPPPPQQQQQQHPQDKMLPAIGYIYDRQPPPPPQQHQQQQQPQQQNQQQQQHHQYPPRPLAWDYVPFPARKENRDGR